MAVNYIDKDVIVWEGDDEGHTVTFNAHSSALDGDLVLVCFACTSSIFHLADSPPPAYVPTNIQTGVVRASSSDGQFDEVISGSTSALQGNHLQVFKRIFRTADVDYDFNIDIEFQDGSTTEDGFDTKVGYFVMLVYRGVSEATPIEYSRHFYNPLGQHGRTVARVTKTDSLIVQFGIVSAWHPISPGGVNPVTVLDSGMTTRDNRLGYLAELVQVQQTTWTGGGAADIIEQRYFKMEFETGDMAAATADNYVVRFNTGEAANALEEGYQALLVLTDAAHDPPDTPDVGTGPDSAGTGYMVWESTDIEALEWERWAEDDDTGDLTILVDSDSTIQCLGATLYYDGMGSCEKGEAYFQSDPTAGSHNSVFRFLIDEPTLSSPAYYYSALAINSKRDAGVWKVELIDLMNLILDGPVGALASTDPPTHTGVFEDTVELFRGKLPTITPSSVDEYQSWRTLQGRRFDTWDVFFGVTSNLKYVQGRVGDGAEISIDYAANKHRMSMQVERSTDNEAVTHWWETAAGIDERDDIDLLTVRRVVETTLDGASAVIIPPKASAPYFAEQSRTFKVAGLVKPPAKVTNIPQVGEQHVVASRVEITAGTSGKVPTISSVIMTSALPKSRT